MHRGSRSAPRSPTSSRRYSGWSPHRPVCLPASSRARSFRATGRGAGGRLRSPATPTKFSPPRVRTAIVPAESRIERVHSSGSCLGITRESESTFTTADSAYFNSPSLNTGTRIGKTNSAPPSNGGRMTPTVGARVSSRRRKLSGSTTFRSGAPQGTRVLTSCWPSSDTSTTVYQPGCVDWMRRPSAWNAARSPMSSVGEVASASSTWMVPANSRSSAAASTRAESRSRRSASARLFAKARQTSTPVSTMPGSIAPRTRIRRWTRRGRKATV